MPRGAAPHRHIGGRPKDACLVGVVAAAVARRRGAAVVETVARQGVARASAAAAAAAFRLAETGEARKLGGLGKLPTVHGGHVNLAGVVGDLLLAEKTLVDKDDLADHRDEDNRLYHKVGLRRVVVFWGGNDT